VELWRGISEEKSTTFQAVPYRDDLSQIVSQYVAAGFELQEEVLSVCAHVGSRMSKRQGPDVNLR
jgi:hypothetical protein